jgi:hypothetical protein
MPVRVRPALLVTGPALLLALAAGCGGGSEQQSLTPAPSTTVSAAPVSGLGLSSEQVTQLVRDFRTQYAGLSNGRSDSQVVQAFADTCRTLSMPTLSSGELPPGSVPVATGADAATQAFTQASAPLALPSVSDAAGLALLAQQRVCPSYTAP